VRRVECAKSFEVWSEGESFVPHYDIEIVNQSYFTEGQYNKKKYRITPHKLLLGFPLPLASVE